MRFLHHINHMRGIAIIPIVAVHCISIFDWPEHRSPTTSTHCLRM